MKRMTSCLAVLVMLIGVGQVWAGPLPGTGVMLFDEATDTIQVSGQTVLGTAATYEAQIMFTDAYSGKGHVFNEWKRAGEDKNLLAGPSFIRGFSYNINWPSPGTFDVNTTISLNNGHRLAYVYDGSEERIYQDGVRVAFRPAPTKNILDANGPAYIGAIPRDGGTPPGLVGYLDSVRISSSARYSGVIFTPPVGDLTSDAHTQLLYNFNEPVGSIFAMDDSLLGRTGILGVGFAGATSPTLVPEPSALTLAAFGLLGFVAWARRRRQLISRA